MATVTRDRFDAFLFDLDGTLLDGAGRLSPGSKAAVGRLVDAGYVVVLATGRSPSGTREVHEALGLRTDLCCYNGAWIGRPGDGPPFHYAPIPDEALPHLASAEGRARFAFRHHRDGKYTAPARDAVHRRVSAWYTNVVEGAALPAADLVRVSLFFEGTTATDAAWGSIPDPARGALHRETFPMSLFPGFEDVDLVLCEVQRRGRGKAEAYRYLHERHGIPADRVVAVGDQANDVPLLAHAGLAVAMGNAVPAVLEAADLVIGDHREDGIARWLAGEMG